MKSLFSSTKQSGREDDAAAVEIVPTTGDALALEVEELAVELRGTVDVAHRGTITR